MSNNINDSDYDSGSDEIISIINNSYCNCSPWQQVTSLHTNLISCPYLRNVQSLHQLHIANSRSFSFLDNVDEFKAKFKNFYFLKKIFVSINQKENFATGARLWGSSIKLAFLSIFLVNELNFTNSSNINILELGAGLGLVSIVNYACLVNKLHGKGFDEHNNFSPINLGAVPDNSGNISVPDNSGSVPNINIIISDKHKLQELLKENCNLNKIQLKILNQSSNTLSSPTDDAPNNIKTYFYPYLWGNTINNTTLQSFFPLDLILLSDVLYFNEAVSSLKITLNYIFSNRNSTLILLAHKIRLVKEEIIYFKELSREYYITLISPTVYALNNSQNSTRTLIKTELDTYLQSIDYLPPEYNNKNSVFNINNIRQAAMNMETYLDFCSDINTNTTGVNFNLNSNNIEIIPRDGEDPFIRILLLAHK